MGKKVIVASQHIFHFPLFTNCQDATTYQTAGQCCNNGSYQGASECLAILNDHIFPNTYDLGEKEEFKVCIYKDVLYL